MITNYNIQRAHACVAWLAICAIFVLPFSVFSQTRISYHSNKYSVQDDVKLGRQAAAEAEQQLPLLRDNEVNDYVERVGSRLVAAIPSEFQHPEFQYFFKVVNAKDINAFALPGGPMYVNRGMIEAARREGEMAGVMAHEISHVALRHGTAQATKGQKYGLLAGILGIGGQILGGPAGAAAQIAGQGVGVYFLKFSREYETEADILGAQIMARAGYDPRDLAAMFETIQRQGGGSSGGFLSSHPSPANRNARINQEAQYLRVQNPIRDTQDFARIQARLRGQGTAPTMAEIARNGQRYPHGSGEGYPGTGRVSNRVEYPSSRYRTYNSGLVRVSVPENWRELPDQSGNSIWFAPEGAYGQTQTSGPVFTHGAEFGLTNGRYRNLRRDTDDFVNALMQNNQTLRQQGGYQRGTIGGRQGLAITLSNVNEVTGRPEVVTVYTTSLSNGELFHVITVVPQDDLRTYQGVFQRILNSVQLNS